MIISSKITSETANELIHFFLAFSEMAKGDKKRNHHLTAGHLAVMKAIPESFENGRHLVEQFTSTMIYKTIRASGLKDSWFMVKKNLNELVRLGYLKRSDIFYSLSIELHTQH